MSIGSVPIFENSPRTVDHICSVIKRYGFEPVTRTKVSSFATLVEDELDPDYVPFAVFDLQDSTKSLRSVGLPQVSTVDGRATGLSLAQEFFLREDSLYKRHPIALMTGLKVIPAVDGKLRSFLKARENSIFFRKDADLTIFEKFVSTAADSFQSKQNVFLLSKEERDALIEQFCVYCKDWGFSLQDKARLLGVALPENTNLSTYFSSIVNFSSIDAFERIRIFLEIRIGLEAVLGGDLAAQQRWLADQQPWLNDSSPISLLLSSDLNSLHSVRELVRRMTG